MYRVWSLLGFVNQAGLFDGARICESGGLWVILNG